jgi:hypothetical protein
MTTRKVFPKLVIYAAEGDAETSVRQLASIIGSARCCRLEDFTPDYYESHDYFIIGGSLEKGHVTADISAFVAANLDRLKTVKTAFFALGGTTDEAAPALASLAAGLPADGVFAKEHIPGGKHGVDAPALAAAALRMRAGFRGMRASLPPAEVRRRVEDILSDEAYIILCTGAGADLRATTVGYKYHDGCVYAMCEGAEKFANILLNPRVALALYRMPDYDGLQATGTASVLYPGTEAYREMCALLGKDHQRLTTLPFALNALVVKLHKAEYYSAKMRQDGYDSKQTCYF